MNKTLTILDQKAFFRSDELVLVPKKEYQMLLEKQPKLILMEKLTASEKKAIARSRKELARGEYVMLDELIHELESPRAKRR